MNGQSRSGQTYHVTITASPNATFHEIGDRITLMCIVDPPITATNVTITYSWHCDDCFANGLTDMAIMRQLTDMDTSMINCSATVDGIEFMTDTPFNLELISMVILITCV